MAVKLNILQTNNIKKLNGAINNYGTISVAHQKVLEETNKLIKENQEMKIENLHLKKEIQIFKNKI